MWKFIWVWGGDRELSAQVRKARAIQLLGTGLDLGLDSQQTNKQKPPKIKMQPFLKITLENQLEFWNLSSLRQHKHKLLVWSYSGPSRRLVLWELSLRSVTHDPRPCGSGHNSEVPTPTHSLSSYSRASPMTWLLFHSPIRMKDEYFTLRVAPQ